MRNIGLLDCTLRDGGYVNNWHFGERTIREVLDKLVVSKVDYIECGYLSQKKEGDPDETLFTTLEALKKILPEKHDSQEYAVMINFGEYDIETIPDADGSDPIIRVCFHKKDRTSALDFCGKLIKKGYKVFVQAMATLNYSDTEFIDLIKCSNDIKPHGFYIVDSFGVLEIRDFQRLISLAENNLDMDIILGYHSHNNLQQAYGNAKFFVEQNIQHNIVLDASVYGIGRGAGNLNMELFASYLNKNYGKNYNLDSFLDIMDEYLKPIFAEHFWGYSLPFYLSAQYNCHPNYASFFAEKNTLSNKSIRQLMASLPDEMKFSYSEDLADKYYQDFQKRYIDDKEDIQYIKKNLESRKVLILAPGKSLSDERDRISTYIDQNDPIIFAVNVMPANFSCDYIICANEKRIHKLKLTDNCKLIVTSNIMDEAEDCLVVNYSNYLVSEKLIADNPTLMLLNMLISVGVKKVVIAGFDGYSANPRDNYFSDNLSMGTSIEIKLQKNELIKKALSEISKSIEITFLTESKYQ